MGPQATLSLEWEGDLSEEDIRTISSALESSSIEGSAKLYTEKNLTGLELVVTTIVIAMATKVGEKIVDGVWSAIKSLRKVGDKKVEGTLTLRARWDNGEAKIVLPLTDEEKLSKRLDALGKLISSE